MALKKMSPCRMRIASQNMKAKDYDEWLKRKQNFEKKIKQDIQDGTISAKNDKNENITMSTIFISSSSKPF